ncbi:MAG: hypothetical protein H0U52_05115 [Chloroflexi bacterium]|nr:hypothetical protein [Chloroflexota bacterium]
MSRRATVLLALAFAAVACGGTPAPSGDPATTDPVVAVSGVDHGFVLTVALPRLQWLSSEQIPVATTLTWTGAAPKQEIWGSGSGHVSFVFRELGGAGRTMGGGGTDDCRSTSYVRGQPAAIPVAKSGGFGGEDPHAAFYEQWYREPGLRLPAGRWQLTVGANGFLVPCEAGAPELKLTLAPLELDIR